VRIIGVRWSPERAAGFAPDWLTSIAALPQLPSLSGCVRYFTHAASAITFGLARLRHPRVGHLLRASPPASARNPPRLSAERASPTDPDLSCSFPSSRRRSAPYLLALPPPRPVFRRAATELAAGTSLAPLV